MCLVKVSVYNQFQMCSTLVDYIWVTYVRPLSIPTGWGFMMRTHSVFFYILKDEPEDDSVEPDCIGQLSGNWQPGNWTKKTKKSYDWLSLPCIQKKKHSRGCPLTAVQKIRSFFLHRNVFVFANCYIQKLEFWPGPCGRTVLISIKKQVGWGLDKYSVCMCVCAPLCVCVCVHHWHQCKVIRHFWLHFRQQERCCARANWTSLEQPGW